MSIIGLTTKVKDVVDGLSKVKAAGEQKREIVENSRLEIKPMHLPRGRRVEQSSARSGKVTY